MRCILDDSTILTMINEGHKFHIFLGIGILMLSLASLVTKGIQQNFTDQHSLLRS